MLTPEQFVTQLNKRRELGESLQAIGQQLGVSHEAVRRWLEGERNPTKTVLLLAERVIRDASAVDSHKAG